MKSWKSIERKLIALRKLDADIGVTKCGRHSEKEKGAKLAPLFFSERWTVSFTMIAVNCRTWESSTSHCPQFTATIVKEMV